jgi:hypothetical protein
MLVIIMAVAAVEELKRYGVDEERVERCIERDTVEECLV